MTEALSPEDVVRAALVRLNPEFHKSDSAWTALDSILAERGDPREALDAVLARIEALEAEVNRLDGAVKSAAKTARRADSTASMFRPIG